MVSSVLVLRVSRPLEAMEQVAERLAAGDLQARVADPTGGREMRALARALNQMAEQLGARMETITSQRNELKAVLASMTEGVLAVDSSGQVLQCNAAAARLLGLDEEQERGRLMEEMVRHSELQRFIRGVQSAGEGAETEIQLPGERTVKLHGTPLEDAAGWIRCWTRSGRRRTGISSR